MNDDVLSFEEAARLCGVETGALIRWMAEGRLKADGGRQTVRRQDLAACLRSLNKPVPPTVLAARKPRLLVADDDEAIVKLIRKLVQKTGWDCEMAVAHNGYEAGQQIMNFDPDVIVLDLFMPGMDGFGVCERVRGLKRQPPIKVLSVSGEMSNENRQKILQAGASDLLPKPFTMEELKGKLLKLCPALGVNPTKPSLRRQIFG